MKDNNWIKRTDLEISQAITRLLENKERCNRFNFFREDNHAKLDVMVRILRERLDQDAVYDQYPSDTPDHHSMWQAAETGYEFLAGDVELEDMLYSESNF